MNDILKNNISEKGIFMNIFLIESIFCRIHNYKTNLYKFSRNYLENHGF